MCKLRTRKSRPWAVSHLSGGTWTAPTWHREGTGTAPNPTGGDPIFSIPLRHVLAAGRSNGIFPHFYCTIAPVARFKGADFTATVPIEAMKPGRPPFAFSGVCRANLETIREMSRYDSRNFRSRRTSRSRYRHARAWLSFWPRVLTSSNAPLSLLAPESSPSTISSLTSISSGRARKPSLGRLCAERTVFSR